MASTNRGYVSRRSAASRNGVASPESCERLEHRTLLSATLVQAIAPVTGGSSSSTTIDLSPSFSDPAVTGTTVEIQTPLGNVPLMLFDSQTPQTVANFEHYISSGEYNNVIIHRSVPGFVIQGGGYTTSGTHITTFGNVQGEPGVSNTTGTIAMALSNGPNSGTSEWFINLANNTNLDDTSDGGPFTAFGKVVYNGMSVVNQIAALPTANVSQSVGAWTNLPVLNNSSSLTASDLVTAKTVNVSPLSYSATSDNPSLVSPNVSGTNLVLNYGSGAGTANVTVTATDLGGGTAVSTFAVNVIPQVTIGSGRGQTHSVRFTDPNGVPATATLAGPGTATVTLSGTGLSIGSKGGVATITGTPTSVTVTTTATTLASTLNITGAATIASISPDDNLGTLNASKASLDGSLTVPGSIGRIVLGNASGGMITVSGAARRLTLSVGTASSEAVTSSEAIASLTAGSWTTVSELGSPSTISAPSIARLSVSKTLNAHISATTLGQANVGTITTSTWSVSGAIGGITAGSITGLNLSAGSVGRIVDRGDATGVVVNSAGNITAISALGISGSRFYAGGPTDDVNGIPTAFPTAASINSVTVGRHGFSNSVLGAATLGRMSLGAVTSTNGGTPFGVAAHTIAALIANVDGKRFAAARVTSADQVSAALTKAGITANDLVIRIV